MIKFAHPSEEFRRRNPHIFGEDKQGRTDAADAIDSKHDFRLERELQAEVVNLLRLHGIEPLWHSTHKRSTATVGWPDVTFAVEVGLKSIPVLWEVKLPGKKLSDEQTKLMCQLLDPPNGWVYQIITSVDQALHELKKLGLA